MVRSAKWLSVASAFEVVGIAAWVWGTQPVCVLRYPDTGVVPVTAAVL